MNGLSEYFSHIEQQLKKTDSIDTIKHQVSLLRRDVNDLHSILMLKNASKKIPKKNLLVFIGTGQINENVFHAYIHFQKALQLGKIKFDGEVLFIARTELEYNLLNNYGYPCEQWKYQNKLALKLLEAKAVVLSSHLYSFFGDCLLTHCVADAIKIQLWHGLPAKNIGLSCIDNPLEFHFFVRLLEDSVSADHVCIQNNNQDVINEYSRAFPFAKQHITGDCRTDILFNEGYRREFLKNKNNFIITEWIKLNKNNIKVLYAPTYRESAKSISEHYDKLLELLSIFDNQKVKLAIKLHIGIVLTNQQKLTIANLCEEKGHLFIESMDEVYSTFNDFDTIIVDYSSIRSEFALTGKPIFLWRFDKESYKRPTDVVDTFSQLDNVSYELPSTISAENFVKTYMEDPKKDIRQLFVEKELQTFSNGSAAERTINVFLEVMKSN